MTCCFLNSFSDILTTCITASASSIEVAVYGTINSCEFEIDPFFGFQIPTKLDDLNSDLLLPKRMWKNEKNYFSAAKELIEKFQANFAEYEINDDLVKNSGPIII